MTAGTRGLSTIPETAWQPSYGLRLNDKACRQPLGSGLGRCGRTFGLHRHACARVCARNVTNPSSCHICQGANWSSPARRRSVRPTPWRRLRHGVARMRGNNAPGNLPMAFRMGRGAALSRCAHCIPLSLPAATSRCFTGPSERVRQRGERRSAGKFQFVISSLAST